MRKRMLVLVATLLAIAVATPVVAFAHDDDDDGDDSPKVVRQHRDGDDDDGDRGHRGKNKGEDEKRKHDEVRVSLSALESATPTFRPLILKGKNEISPPVAVPQDARARGLVSFDLVRGPDGSDADSLLDILSGKVVFFFNYHFSGPVAISGLHVHFGNKISNGPIVISSGISLDCSNAAAVTAATDADGQGNLTMFVTTDTNPATPNPDPSVLQAILNAPKDYYVNLHTCANPDGAVRAQLRRPKAI